MRVSAKHDGLKNLQADLRKIPPTLIREGSRIVRDNVRDGGQTARRIAKWTAGRHGKDYPKAITFDRSASTYFGFGGGSIKAAYGPDSALPQGGMEFEEGSRNQPPHNDLANSLDLVRPKFYRDTDQMLDKLFWLGEDR